MFDTSFGIDGTPKMYVTPAVFGVPKPAYGFIAGTLNSPN
jgi:hypothetical protein